MTDPCPRGARRLLPDGASDARSGETALAVALGGVICPVPFVMSAAAMRIASPRRSRRAKLAFWIALTTIVLQVAGIVVLAATLLG
jgi:hypothetical protein